jgi:hypothetical protein
VHERIEHDVTGAGNYSGCHALYDGNKILWVSQANPKRSSNLAPDVFRSIVVKKRLFHVPSAHAKRIC